LETTQKILTQTMEILEERGAVKGFARCWMEKCSQFLTPPLFVRAIPRVRYRSIRCCNWLLN
ncbi:MAG: hypothetical protein ACRDFB_08305, partial [Rhabdochlamydiaceae bacterium]